MAAVNPATLVAAQRLGSHSASAAAAQSLSIQRQQENSPAAPSALRYYGRCMPVGLSSPQRDATVRTVAEAAIAIRPLAAGASGGGWAGLAADLNAVLAIISDPGVLIPEYKLEILREAVCPYLLEMRGRWVLDPERFQQLHQVLGALNLAEGALKTASPTVSSLGGDLDPSSSSSLPEHPAHSLLAVEAVIRAVDAASSRAWFQSQLAKRLRQNVHQEWAPILSVLRWVYDTYMYVSH